MEGSTVGNMITGGEGIHGRDGGCRVVKTGFHECHGKQKFSSSDFPQNLFDCPQKCYLCMWKLPTSMNLL